MPGTTRLTALVLLGGLVYLVVPRSAQAQLLTTPMVRPPSALGSQVGAGASESAPGTIDGTIRNDRGEPVSGVVVTAIGSTTAFAVTDERGHFEIAALLPGSYLLRAHSSGYLSPKPRTVRVRANARAASSFAIRKAAAQPAILAAGLGGVSATVPEPGTGTETTDDAANVTDSDDHSETAWRLRHLRRGVLRDVDVPSELFSDEPEDVQTVAVMLGRAVSAPARAATSFFADAPLSGSVNILTTNTFDSPEQLLSGSGMARGIAYLKVGAPVGGRADWTVRAALTDGDLSSWIVAGAYQTRGAARRARDIGMSYSTQHYGGGNPLALRQVTDGARNAGSIYAFETFTVNRALTVAYGGRYERFDYLEQRNLLSPKAEVTLSPFNATRMTVSLSSRADAPGAQEFRPPGDEGVWLPPQRTFSSVEKGQALRAERTNQVSASLARDFGPTTVTVRGFRQQVTDQMVTVFGADVPDYPGTRLGHYVVGSAGNVDANGGSVALNADLGPRLRGSVTYTSAVATVTPATDVSYIVLLSPSTIRRGPERLQDVTSTIAADVPETSTRVLVLYRIGTGYARAGDARDPRLDSRFDVQVRQALPFLNFTNAKWEMLVAVRNSFREVAGEQSVYDELLTVQAPKRIVGGVTLHF